MRHLSLLVPLSWSIYLLLVTLSALRSVGAQDDDAENGLGNDVLNPAWSYCFEFTWFGPQYDNFTRYDGTCGDYLDLVRAKNVPCSPPIVITYDGTPPDIDYLWNNHRASVLCKKSKNQVCAVYTYKFNGIVNNATYMCTKVPVMNEQASLSSGCYSQVVEGYEVEMCLCDSTPGYRPCNSAVRVYDFSLFLVVILVIVEHIILN